MAALEGFGTTRPFQPGEVLISEAQPQTSFFIVLEGALEVVSDQNGREIKLSDLGVGDCFGEVAIFEPGVASATVRAAGAGSVWTQDAHQLQEFLAANPFPGSGLLLGINLVLSERVLHSNEIIKASSISPSFLSIRGKLKSRLRPTSTVDVRAK
ncbi:MAG: cyclic nucleotide-binding domain-containing protein [Verrucomicrobiota bacterium]